MNMMSLTSKVLPAIEREFTMNVNGLDLAVKTWGDEKNPPILAIHGWLDNCASFSRIAPYLDHYYVVAPDLAGHGKSDHRKPNHAYYLWDYAIDLSIFVRKMGWNSYSILAHSMGTGVASILNTISKGIKRIVFIDGMGAPFTVSAEDVVRHLKTSLRLSEMAHLTKLNGFSEKNQPLFSSMEVAVKTRQKVVGGFISLDSARRLAERDLQAVESGYRWRHDPRLTIPEPIQLTDEQAGRFLNQIDCPLTILLGTSGLFVGDKFHSKSQYLAKNAKVSWYEGGHHLHLENLSHEMILDIKSSFANH